MAANLRRVAPFLPPRQMGDAGLAGSMVEMRMFVAVVPPAEVLDDLAGFLEPRRDADPEVRWAPAGQWHLTLAFLPAVPERRLDDLVERLARAAVRRRSLEACLDGGGAFPSPARSKVLWVGVDAAPAEDLFRLASGCRAAAAKAGAEVRGGRFRPHLTVARLRRPVDATRWIRVLGSYRGPAWTVNRIELIESHLGQGPGGRSRYSTAGTFALGPGAGPADRDSAGTATPSSATMLHDGQAG